MQQPAITPTTPNSIARPQGSRMRALAGLLILAGMATLLPVQVQAQTGENEGAAAAPTNPSLAPPSSTVTFYDPKELERAFNFMDKTGDGKVSRDEASNFRGVSRNFDKADLDKDNFLTREEFDHAMNRSKAR